MKLLAIATVSFTTCLAMELAGIRIAPALGLLDIPGGRRKHASPVPKVGGLALFAAILVLSRVHGFTLPLSPVEAVAIFCMTILGFLDDRLDLRARWKAILGLVLAVALAVEALHHLQLPITPYPLLGLPIPATPGITFLLLVMLFWGIPQAFNLIDGANGLAIGFGLIIVGSLWLAGFPHPLLGGGLLACLVLNWPRARLFLGDCGSLSIGLLLVLFAQQEVAMPSPNKLLWLFAYPILDVLTVSAIRMTNRKPVFEGDRNHLHHHLGDRWPSLSFLAVPILLGIAALCSSAIYVTGTWRILPYAGLAMLTLLAGYVFLTTVLHFRKLPQTVHGKGSGDLPLPD